MSALAGWIGGCRSKMVTWRGYIVSACQRIGSSQLQNWCQSKCKSLTWSSFRNGEKRDVGENEAWYCNFDVTMFSWLQQQNICVEIFFFFGQHLNALLLLFLSRSPLFVLWLFFCNSSRIQLCSPFHSFLVRYCFTAFICCFNLLPFANKLVDFYVWLLI